MSRRFAARSSAPAGEVQRFFPLLWRPASAAWLAGWLLCLLAGLLYFSTLDTGLLPRELEGGDLITHQYAQVQARPSNAPGYPLYTMGGWLWFHGWRSLLRLVGHPLPNPLPILGSYSTFWALIALWLLYRILLHLSRSLRRPAGHWPLAWLITAFYAVTYFFWYYATTTEQYSSAVAHTLAIMYVYLLWDEARERGRGGAGERQAARYLFLLAFLCGLSLAHMVTVAMIVPPLVAVVLWTEPRLLRRPLTVLGAVLAAALPLVSYIYVYLRGAAHPEWWGQGEWTTANDWFWSFVRTAQGQDELSWGLQPGAPFFGNGFPDLIWQELSVPLLVLGLIGIACLRPPLRLTGDADAAVPAGSRSGLRLAFLLYATLLLYLGLCWVDRFGNWFQVILPAYPLILLGLLPIGLWLEAWFSRSPGRSVSRLGTGPFSPVRVGLVFLPQALMLAAVLWRLVASLPAADSRHRPEDTALIRPALLLDQPLPEDAALFAEKDDALGLDYLINIWGIRSDLQVVSSPEANAVLDAGGVILTPWTAAALLRSELHIAGPVALWAQTPDWVALQTDDSAAVAPPAVPLDLAAGDGIRLLGYTVRTGPTGDPVLPAAAPLDLYLYWQVDPSGTPSNWSISVRPLRTGMQVMGADGTPIQYDSPGPVHGLRPFGEFDAGKMIVDAYRLPGGTAWDEIQVVLYRAVDGGFENLAVLNFPFVR